MTSCSRSKGSRRDLLAGFLADGLEELCICQEELVDLERGKVVAKVAVGFCASERTDELALDDRRDRRNTVRKGVLRIRAPSAVAERFYSSVSSIKKHGMALD